MLHHPSSIHNLIAEGSFILRPILNSADLIGILQVYEDCFGRLPPVKPMRRALLRHRWLLVCVVERDQAPIVGFMVFAVKGKRKQVHILRIAVAKQFRRRGLASTMIKDLIAHAKGYTIYAKVGEKNLGGLSLFKKLGFSSRLIRREEGCEDSVLFFYHVPVAGEG